MPQNQYSNTVWNLNNADILKVLILQEVFIKIRGSHDYFITAGAYGLTEFFSN